MDFQLNLEGESLETIPLDAPHCVAPTTPLGDVVQQMRTARRGSVLVAQDGALLGIFTERDALRLMAAEVASPANSVWRQPVSTAMTAKPVTVSRSDSVATAIERMAHGGYRHLPVVDAQGVPVGELTAASIVHFLVEHFPTIVYTLPPDPHHKISQREGA